MAKTNAKRKKARKRHAKSCDGKQAYPNKKSAERSAEKLRANKNWHLITAYECQQCKSWHLGNRSW